MGAYGLTTMGANGNSPIVPIHFTPYFTSSPPWTLGIVVTISKGGSMTYSVQITCDPHPSSEGNWNNYESLSNLTSSTNGSISFPVSGLRLVISNWGSGTCSLGICQWP